jgi:hypothetical protein
VVTPHRVDGQLVEELLSAELDHALSAAEARALQEHLRACHECKELAARQDRLHIELRTSASPGDARHRKVIWAGIASRRARPRRALAGRVLQFGLAAAVLVAAVLTGLVFVDGPAAAPPPLREVVASASFELPGGQGTLTVEQGTALARAGAQIGVGARAELRLAQAPTRGEAEIRFRRQGESAYGVLGASPDIAGSTRASFGGSFSRPAAPDKVTYEVWVHFESALGSVDTPPLVISISATRRGEEVQAR